MLSAVEVHSKVKNTPKLLLPLIGNDGLGPFHIRNIEGLGPVKATVNSRGYGLLDGEYYTGSHVGKRNIVMTLGLNPAASYRSAEILRRVLYLYLAPKTNAILKFATQDRPLVTTECFVESLEFNLFTKDPEVQVSVISPKPHFDSDTLKVVTGVASRAPADVAFEYDGDRVNGVVFKLFESAMNYTGDVLIEQAGNNPVYRKFETKANISSGVTISPVRYFWVNSHQGVKVVESRSVPTKLRVVNLLPTLTDESLWPYLVPGINKIRVKINSDNPIPWEMAYIERWGGL